MKLTPRELFTLKYTEDQGCWVWQSDKNRAGHGIFHKKLAHNVAWEMRHGPLPKGATVKHKCTAPACVRPSHLTLGPLAGNGAGKAKLTGEQASAIKLLKGNAPLSKVAVKFGVSISTIYKIQMGLSWQHLI